MIEFQKINSQDNIKEVLKSAFGVDINISGSWGYFKEDCSDISEIKDNINNTENMIATMRANIEMNMLLDEDNRYGSINLHEISREEDEFMHKVGYDISAMKESEYKIFIQEYKDNFNNESFDLEMHFHKRKQATIKRNVLHYFRVKR